MAKVVSDPEFSLKQTKLNWPHPDSCESDKGETTSAGIKKACRSRVKRSTPGFMNSTTLIAFESFRESRNARTVNIPTFESNQNRVTHAL